MYQTRWQVGYRLSEVVDEHDVAVSLDPLLCVENPAAIRRHCQTGNGRPLQIEDLIDPSGGKIKVTDGF